MNEITSSETPQNSIERALAHIRRVKLTSLLFLPLPLLILGAVLSVWYFIFPERSSDLFVIIILSLFTIGQVTALFQFISIFKGSLSTNKVLSILNRQGVQPDLKQLEKEMAEQPPSTMRDLLMKWIYLSLKGEVNGNHRILENTTHRRSFTDDKRLSFHVALNRVTLKLGFLGTLIGLLLTFSPMKQAILSLQEANGHMAFVKDIVQAIQGDEYAIFSTLVATALSMLIELFTIQLLMRLFSGFEMCDSHINDWNIMVLQRLGKEQKLKNLPDVLQAQAELTRKSMKIFDAVDKNVNLFMGAVEHTERQLEKLTQLQERIGKRVEQLLDYEKQYRDSTYKKGKDLPDNLRPDYFDEA